MKLRKVFTKRIQSLKEDPPTEECSKSVQSFRDIIPSDNRLDLNSATEKQLHTLPGLNKVSFTVLTGNDIINNSIRKLLWPLWIIERN